MQATTVLPKTITTHSTTTPKSQLPTPKRPPFPIPKMAPNSQSESSRSEKASPQLENSPPERLITPANEHNTINFASKDIESDSHKDRQERAVAALLTRFNNLVLLAAQPVDDGATLETAAAHAYQMEVETNGLACPLSSAGRIKEIEKLIRWLRRRFKQRKISSS